MVPHSKHIPSFKSSIVGTYWQLSHCSAFVSVPHFGHIIFNSLSDKNLLHFSQKACGSSFSYIYPDVPLGVADALLHAENFVSGEPFYLLYGDVLFSAKPNSLEQMKKVFDEAKCSVVATRKVKQSKTNLYGCLSLKEAKGQKYITSIVEKPHPKVAPSNIVIAGQFLLTSKIFKYLKNLTAGQLFTDALLCLAKNNNLAIAEIEGKCFDIGNKAGYVLATLHYAQSHSQIKKEIKSFLYSFNKNNAKK